MPRWLTGTSGAAAPIEVARIIVKAICLFIRKTCLPLVGRWTPRWDGDHSLNAQEFSRIAPTAVAAGGAVSAKTGKRI